MPKTIHTRIQKRFDDIDVFRHVNNVCQQQYFDVGKTELFQNMLGVDILSDNVRALAVSTKTDYMGQVLWDYDLWVSTSLAHIGNKSLTVFQQLYRMLPGGEHEVLTESTSVLVAFDFAAQASVPVPDAWRERLSE